MDIIPEELNDVERVLLAKVPGCDLISCHRNLVSFRITKTKFKNLIACIQFPSQYPNEPLLVEVKSKVFSSSVTNTLSDICYKEAKKHLGKKQIILIAKFLRQFLEENPLLPCRDEWAFIKKNFIKDCDHEKVRQKKGIIEITANQDQYFLKIRTVVPDNYPEEPIELAIEKHNFPGPMAYYFISQAREYARQATEPPLRKNSKAPPFQPEPHLKKVMEFLIARCCRRLPQEDCPLCKAQALPTDPKDIVMDGKDDKYIERVYCGHLFHHGCLDKFMKTPPFQDGKSCPKCSKRIYHDKWNITPRLAEERWAHKEARERELDEVVDFLS